MSRLVRRFTVSRKQRGTDLQSFVATHGDLSRRKAKDLIDSRRILVNGKRIWIARHRLNEGDTVTLPPPKAADTAKDLATPLEIIYEDAHLVAINKPSNVLSDRDRHSAEEIVRKQLSRNDLRALHRLDKETTGLLLFTPASEREPWIDLFRANTIKKTYRAIIAGTLPQSTLTVRTPIDGKRAESRFRQLVRGRECSLIDVRIITGRTHQIRKHLKTQRLWILGDTHYAPSGASLGFETTLSHHLLHAASLKLSSPVTGREIHLTAPFPSEFQGAMNQLGLK